MLSFKGPSVILTLRIGILIGSSSSGMMLIESSVVSTLPGLSDLNLNTLVVGLKSSGV